MKKDNNEIAGIPLRLIELKQKIVDFVDCGQYGVFCANYKDILAKLVYWGKFGLSFELPLEAKALIQECTRAVKTVELAAQPAKFGQTLPCCAWVNSRYGSLHPWALKVEQQKIIQRVEKNQESKRYRNLPVSEISTLQLEFLKGDRTECFFDLLRNGQVFLQNPQCICCSQVFMKNFTVHNRNPLFASIVDLGSKKTLDKLTLERHINAVCNEGGGVILIGADRKDGAITITGKRFANHQQILQKQREILQAIATVKPGFDYILQRVLVHSSYLEDEDRVAQEYMRICLRLQIFLRQPERVNYLQYPAKGNHRTFEMYKLDQNLNPVRILQNQTESSYSLIHKRYRRAQKKVSSHQNIRCFRPHEHYSSAFHTLMTSNIDFKLPPEEEKPQIIKINEPKFKYPQASLLIVDSEKEVRHINDFSKALDQGKYVFECSQPFSDYFKEDIRSVYLMTHEINFIEVKNCLKMFNKKGSVKADEITIMPVYKILEMQSSKYTKVVAQTLQKKIGQHYNKKLHATPRQSVQMVYLYFESLGEAIFAYMICEQLKIRPYFVRDMAVAEKKLLD